MAQDFASWLTKLGLDQYLTVLEENDIDLESVAYLSENDLKELGISLGHRRKLQMALRQNGGSAPKAGMHGLRDNGNNVGKIGDTPPSPARAAERRQVTIVFCDLVGSTALAQRVDPEALQEIMHRYQDAVAGAIIRFGGYVARYQGDGVVALFGWPNAYEDQAERALRASLSALSVLGEARRDSAQHTVSNSSALNEELHARCGIATGSVVVGDLLGSSPQDRDAIYGDTPNLAARLQTLAKPDEIMLDKNTRALAGTYFEMADTGRHALKGFRAPVRAWRLVGEKSGTSRFEAYRGGSLTEFVGREPEISVIRARWARSSEGEGQVLVLAGEPGLGKSRILREFLRSCKEGTPTARLQCSPHYTNSAFYPFVNALSALMGLDSLSDLNLAHQQIAQEVAGLDIPEAGALIEDILGVSAERQADLTMTPQRRKMLTIETLAALFGQAKLSEPKAAHDERKKARIVILEDLHWVDASTLETVEVLIQRVQSEPTLVIITHRPEFDRRWDTWPHVTHLTLKRLTRAQGAELITKVAGGKTLPDQITSQILSQTDGVPLFIEELTRALIEGENLMEQNNAYVLTGPLPALAIPSTLQDSLMARLDRLAPVKEVIQAAACIGREFDKGLLSKVTTRSDTGLADALDQLVAAQLIFRKAGGEPERFIFKHALIQDAAYASLLTANRIKMHARLVTVLREALAEGADVDPLDLARHHAAAQHPIEAATLYVEVGERLLATSSLTEAIGALEQGLKQCDAITNSDNQAPIALRTRVALGIARMANFGWAHPSVSEALKPAYSIAVALNNREALGSLLWGLWVHYQTRTNFAEAHIWLSRLEEAAQQDDNGVLPIVRDMSAGCQYFWQAEYKKALTYTKRLEKTYSPDFHGGIALFTNHDPLCFALHWAGALLDWITGRPDASLERLQTAIERARQVGHPFNRVFALTAGATNLIYLQDTDRLLDFCAEAESVVCDEGLGVFAEEVLIGQWRGGALVAAGRFNEGYPIVKSGNDFWTRMEGRICSAMFKSWVAQGLAGIGQKKQAIELIEATIKHCADTGDRYMEPECWRLHAHLLAECGANDAEIDQSLATSVSLARERGARSWELRAAYDSAKRLVKFGNPSSAQAILEPVVSHFTEGHGTADYRNAVSLLETL